MERARHRGRAPAAGAPRGYPALGSHRVRPLVIAHRGASGYLPEHTLEAKSLAYGFGADFLEQDIVATRDGALVVLHDLYLDAVSDVAERFPGRARDDGRHYVVDFDLFELQELRLFERRAASGELAFPERFRSRQTHFRIATLEQELELVHELNRISGREVGIYPEIKHPAFHHEHGIELGARLLEALGRHGYESPEDNVFVQCFDRAELVALRAGTGAALAFVQLIEPGATIALDSTRASGIDAIGCAWTDLAVPADDGQRLIATPLAQRLREAGLPVHAYTLRRDAPGELGRRFEDVLAFLYDEVGVAAVFTDHPDIALDVRARPGGGAR